MKIYEPAFTCNAIDVVCDSFWGSNSVEHIAESYNITDIDGTDLSGLIITLLNENNREEAESLLYDYVMDKLITIGQTQGYITENEFADILFVPANYWEDYIATIQLDYYPDRLVLNQNGTFSVGLNFGYVKELELISTNFKNGIAKYECAGQEYTLLRDPNNGNFKQLIEW